MGSLRTSTRIKKLLTSITNPRCWRALANGVFPAIEHLKMLRGLSVDGILDVGANRGQFTLSCQLTHPGKSVVAFEPIPSEATRFKAVHGRNNRVKLIETALGSTAGSAVLHLSKRPDCSSLLAIGDRQTELVPGTHEVASIQVPVQRLDDLTANWNGNNQQLLKLDVQGFELEVLKGAVETLKSCRYVYAECSEVPLYEGQALKPEISLFLQQAGFREVGMYSPVFDRNELIQADYLFEQASA